MQRVNGIMKSNISTGEKLKRVWGEYLNQMRKVPVIGPLIKNVEGLARSIGLMGDKGKKASEDVRRLAPAIRNAIRTNDIGALKRYQGELGKLGPAAAKSAARVRSALRNATAGNDVTWKRWAKGLDAIPKAGEGAVGRLLRVFGRIPKVQKLALKTNSPEVVATLARLAGRLRNLGRTRTVAKIIAESKTPEEAIKRLRGLLTRINRQRAKARVTPEGDKKTYAALRKVVTVKFPPKTQKVGEKGSGGVFGWLKRIFGFNFKEKIQVLKETGGKGVIATLAKIFSFPARKVIEVVTKFFGGRAEGGPVGGPEGFAEGGTPGAIQHAVDRGPSDHSGGRFSRPTYLVGEENRPEFVIATNPAYREANIGYLRQAAAALGVVPGFAHGGRVIKDPEGNWRAPHGPNARQAEDGSWIERPGSYWGRGGGSNMFNFVVTAGFARGGMVRAEDGSWVPRSFYTRGRRGVVRAEDGSWVPRSFYSRRSRRRGRSLEHSAEDDELLGISGGDEEPERRERPEPYDWSWLPKLMRAAPRGAWGASLGRTLLWSIGDFRRARRARDEKWMERSEEGMDRLREQFEELVGMLVERAQVGQLAGHLSRGQGSIMGAFRQQFGLPNAGSFAIGGKVKRSGVALVHRGERIMPDPQGPNRAYPTSAAAAPAGSPQINVEVVLKDRAGELVELVDARVDARADARIEVKSRQQSKRTRALRSAPGYGHR